MADILDILARPGRVDNQSWNESVVDQQKAQQAQQITQQNKLRLQAEQLAQTQALKKQQALRQAVQQSNGDPQKVVDIYTNLTGDVETAQKLQEGLDKHVSDQTKRNSDELALDMKRNERIGGALEGSLDTKNPSEAMFNLSKARAKLGSEGIQLPDFKSPDDAKLYLNQIGLQGSLAKKAADQQKLAADQAEEARKAALAPSVLQQSQNTAALNTPNANNVTAAQQMTADQAATNAAATNTREQDRIKMEAQRIALEQSKNARDQQVYNQTYGAGSNEALRGVDPKLRVQASSAAQKAANEYQTAKKAGDDIQTLIDAARSGNKQAGTNLPLVGVEALNALQGIKRINRAEIDQYEGAGTLLDQIQGKIGKLTSGQPIPADVLKDIESLHKTLTGNAAKAYNEKLNGINQNYRSEFKPVGGETGSSGPLGKMSTDDLFKMLTK